MRPFAPASALDALQLDAPSSGSVSFPSGRLPALELHLDHHHQQVGRV